LSSITKPDLSHAPKGVKNTLTQDPFSHSIALRQVPLKIYELQPRKSAHHPK
jgi:hypothetical protein